MRGRAKDDVIDPRMQTPITRVELQMHHIPAFEVDVADLPLLPRGIAAENKSTLSCTNKNLYRFAHDNLQLGASIYALIPL